jgi:hypothetical protein
LKNFTGVPLVPGMQARVENANGGEYRDGARTQSVLRQLVYPPVFVLDSALFALNIFAKEWKCVVIHSARQSARWPLPFSVQLSYQAPFWPDSPSPT